MIDFTHRTHPRSRTLKIKVEPNGQVVVVTPPRFPSGRISRFVEEHLAWIQKTQAKLKTQRQSHATETNVMIFGKIYHKEVIFSLTDSVGVKIKQDTLLINTINGQPGKPSQSEANRTLERFLKQTAEKYLIPRTHQLAQKMGITFGHISLRQQKTRWGSCSSQGNLNFNWRLVHYQPAIIDYVIIHELAHRTEMNHSSRFWDIVRQYDPDYLAHRGWLKRHGWAEGS